jgi:hypothetical protein
MLACTLENKITKPSIRIGVSNKVLLHDTSSFFIHGIYTCMLQYSMCL